MAFQYLAEIPGVSTKYFLRAAVNAVREHRDLDELDAYEFLKMVKEKAEVLDLDTLLDRSVNYAFSGGEKKRAEVFQMAMLDPGMCVLDETDPDWTSMPSRSCPTESTPCVTALDPSSSSRTTSVCSTTSSPTRCTS